MSSTQTDYAPLIRQRWWTDSDGARATSKRSDELIQVVIDWSDQLATSETVSSAAYVDSGVTRSGASTSSSTTTTSVTGLGEFEVTVTLSTGRKLQQVRRFYGPTGPTTRDYRT